MSGAARTGSRTATASVSAALPVVRAAQFLAPWFSVPYTLFMTRDDFREALLTVMEKKRHWAWAGFTEGLVPAGRLHWHLEQEYGTYVRDFAVLLGRAYVQCPSDPVRRLLAENLYEEETGGLSGGIAHAELFLDYPRGLGMDLDRFRNVELLPMAASFRSALDDATQKSGWSVAVAVTTLFLEGTPYERGELDSSAPKRPEPDLAEHPLVKHYGLQVEQLALTRAHRQVEGDHRGAAWDILLNHIPEEDRHQVVERMRYVLGKWRAYRDEIAQICGIERSPAGLPPLAA